MATDPSQLLMHLAQAPGLVTDSVFAGRNQRLGEQQAQQNLTLGGQQIDQNALILRGLQQEQQKQQEYDQWAQGFAADPTPNNLLAGISRFPKQYQALKAGWDIKDNAQRTADLRFFSEVHGALQSNRPELAIKTIEGRLQAEKAAGLDTTEEENLLEQLRAGDKNAAGAVKAYALANIASATGPDQFAKTFGAVGGERGTKVVMPGGALVDETGKAIYTAPAAPKAVTVSPGETVVEYQPGGGGPASGGGGGSGRYTGGWTPRERNGGDNPDNVVDNKIAGAAQALGVDPDADISGKSPMEIAKAMALSEGGAGSLADRNNNPGNIIDPKTGQFRKFPSKEAGLAAAAAQVKRNLSRGQTTVRSMIEGLPAGQSGGPRIIAQGAPKPQYRMLSPEEKQAQGLDPNIQYQVSPSGQITPLGGQNRQVKQIPDAVATKVQPSIDARDTLSAAIPAFKDEYGGHWLLGDRANDLQAIAGTGPEGMRDWWSRIYSMDNVVRNQLFGSALTATEQAAWERTTVSPKMQPKAIRSNLEKRKAILDAALSRRQKFLKANGYDPDAVDVLFSPLGADGTTQAAPSAPVRVRTIQEARKLAPGTIYVAPNGKRYRR